MSTVVTDRYQRRNDSREAELQALERKTLTLDTALQRVAVVVQRATLVTKTQTKAT